MAKDLLYLIGLLDGNGYSDRVHRGLDEASLGLSSAYCDWVEKELCGAWKGGMMRGG